MESRAAGRTATLVLDARCELGEGPLYDEPSQALWWLDIPRQEAHRLTLAGDREHQVHDLPSRVSCLGRAAGGELVAAGERGVHLIASITGEWQHIADLPMLDRVVTNDGAVDPHGRLWIGTADLVPSTTRGQLFIVSVNGEVSAVRAGVSMSNGVGFSPDGRSAYHVDTRRHSLTELHLSDDGMVLEEREIVLFTTMPDGLAVDLDGGIWVAQWDGRCVERRLPDGTLDEILTVDGGWITSCAFGPEFDLYVTSASSDSSPDAPPHAGGLFLANVGIGGVPPGVFGA